MKTTTVHVDIKHYQLLMLTLLYSLKVTMYTNTVINTQFKFH